MIQISQKQSLSTSKYLDTHQTFTRTRNRKANQSCRPQFPNLWLKLKRGFILAKKETKSADKRNQKLLFLCRITNSRNPAKIMPPRFSNKIIDTWRHKTNLNNSSQKGRPAQKIPMLSLIQNQTNTCLRCISFSPQISCLN